MTMSFELDHRGAEEVLKKLAADEIHSLARKVGDHAKRSGDYPDELIVVDTYTTDRAAASVSVPAELQAKDGVLTRAAAAAGLDVRLK
ncbi:hypothetical protein ACPCIR_12690 [Mycobacterium sp. NPDC051198]